MNGTRIALGTLLAPSPLNARVLDNPGDERNRPPAGRVRAQQRHNAYQPQPAGVPGNAAPTDGLQEAIAELARTAARWDDEEFQYRLRKRCGIEASLTDVHEARLALNGAAAR